MTIPTRKKTIPKAATTPLYLSMSKVTTPWDCRNPLTRQNRMAEQTVNTGVGCPEDQMVENSDFILFISPCFICKGKTMDLLK